MLFAASIVKAWDTSRSSVPISEGVSFVQVHMVMNVSVKVRFLVLIVVVLTQLPALTVLLTSVDMRVLQSNVQSVGTSLPLLRHTLQHRLIDVALLQEIWHPADDSFRIRNYAEPMMKLRQCKEGGGVAIITHNKVKSVHLKEYDVDGLEAVWADVMIDKKRMVVGSVYIAPGDIQSLTLFDNVVDKILHCQSHFNSNGC